MPLKKDEIESRDAHKHFVEMIELDIHSMLGNQCQNAKAVLRILVQILENNKFTTEEIDTKIRTVLPLIYNILNQNVVDDNSWNSAILSLTEVEK